MFNDNSDSRVIQIAIDGPAGAGKSTIARILSERLGIMLLDTGAMYRAFCFFAIKNNVPSDSSDEVFSALFSDFDLQFEEDRILLSGEDITSAVRTPEIDKGVGAIASNAFIRSLMVQLQRKIAENKSVVMEGRDIGSVVLKDTPYKFYLDADVSVRADRRQKQNEQKGINSNAEDIQTDIIRRDRVDSTREASPLTVSEGSIYIDSTDKTQDEVAELIIQNISEAESDAGI